MPPPESSGPPLIGPLIAQLRLARRWSQPRLAAELCAVSDVPTLGRHEISRWERQLRVPGDFWLGWLAVVLAVPVALLVEAATRTRSLGTAPAVVGARSRSALLALAQRWLLDPGDPSFAAATGWLPPTGPPTGAGAAPPTGVPALPPAGAGQPPPTGVPALPPTGPVDRSAEVIRLAELRRLDDLSGGAELSGIGFSWLRRVARASSEATPVDRRRLLPVLAETAQLCGWLAADAGAPTDALEAYRFGLRAAGAAGDPALAGHLLGSASHLLASVGDPHGALVLARTGYAGCHTVASPRLRALLLHRIALAAALGGRHQPARCALAAAQRAADRVEEDREPPWLYWVDGPELAAMTGRALVVLRRPRRAVALLGVGQGSGRPRSGAVYGGWLARAHLQLGEVEQACAVADDALLDAVRAGSPRAVTQLTAVRRGLAPHRHRQPVRRHLALVAAAGPYLPRPVTGSRPDPTDRTAPPVGNGGADRPGTPARRGPGGRTGSSVRPVVGRPNGGRAARRTDGRAATHSETG
ncbi:hypothetical protein [Micromonospora yangpuensis]|uniref:Helix-turn-helix domain-containing protein n=1 Tax=Micromonospora yangpuensis TaxID=683228 RepID=A0A1C6V116_9ACTN|nr:hypothetical protein [Micromonospora yangpuensis]GGL96683.1 hypothetical protein GCM10012279_12680 [Micromonospora yangpuensis]SCL59680.1 hypothetical protein GA0070617_4168 [Micromonospora yangpuensis]